MLIWFIWRLLAIILFLFVSTSFRPPSSSIALALITFVFGNLRIGRFRFFLLLIKLSELRDHLSNFLLRYGHFISVYNTSQRKVDHDILPFNEKLFFQRKCGLIMPSFAFFLLDQSEVQILHIFLQLGGISNIQLELPLWYWWHIL